MKTEDFNVRLKQGLNYRHLKPIQLAEKLNINRAIISQYLSGRYKPNHNRIYEIANVLQVNEAWLLGLDVPMVDSIDDEIIKLYNANKQNLTDKDKKNIKIIINKNRETDNH